MTDERISEQANDYITANKTKIGIMLSEDARTELRLAFIAGYRIGTAQGAAAATRRETPGEIEGAAI